MPLLRKIIAVGKSRAITLPYTWLKLIEEEHGKIDAVEIEVDGEIRVRPYIIRPYIKDVEVKNEQSQ